MAGKPFAPTLWHAAGANRNGILCGLWQSWNAECQYAFAIPRAMGEDCEYRSCIHAFIGRVKVRNRHDESVICHSAKAASMAKPRRGSAMGVCVDGDTLAMRRNAVWGYRMTTLLFPPCSFPRQMSGGVPIAVGVIVCP